MSSFEHWLCPLALAIVKQLISKVSISDKLRQPNALFWLRWFTSLGDSSPHKRTRVTGCPPGVSSGSERESGASLGLVPETSRPSSLPFEPGNESGASFGLAQGTSRSSFVVQTGTILLHLDLD